MRFSLPYIPSSPSPSPFSSYRPHRPLVCYSRHPHDDSDSDHDSIGSAGTAPWIPPGRQRAEAAASPPSVHSPQAASPAWSPVRRAEDDDYDDEDEKDADVPFVPGQGGSPRIAQHRYPPDPRQARSPELRSPSPTRSVHQIAEHQYHRHTHGRHSANPNTRSGQKDVAQEGSSDEESADEEYGSRADLSRYSEHHRSRARENKRSSLEEDEERYRRRRTPLSAGQEDPRRSRTPPPPLPRPTDSVASGPSTSPSPGRSPSPLRPRSVRSPQRDHPPARPYNPERYPAYDEHRRRIGLEHLVPPPRGSTAYYRPQTKQYPPHAHTSPAPPPPWETSPPQDREESERGLDREYSESPQPEDAADAQAEESRHHSVPPPPVPSRSAASSRLSVPSRPSARGDKPVLRAREPEPPASASTATPVSRPASPDSPAAPGIPTNLPDATVHLRTLLNTGPDADVGLHTLADPPPGEKPNYPLPTLIKLAIHGSPRKRLTLQEIYTALEDRFEWFRDNNSESAWKNSIRHNLSLRKCFLRVQRPITEPGKGSYWMIDLTQGEGNKRVRKRNKKPTKAQLAAEEAQKALRLPGQGPSQSASDTTRSADDTMEVDHGGRRGDRRDRGRRAPSTREVAVAAYEDSPPPHHLQHAPTPSSSRNLPSLDEVNIDPTLRSSDQGHAVGAPRTRGRPIASMSRVSPYTVSPQASTGRGEDPRISESMRLPALTMPQLPPGPTLSQPQRQPEAQSRYQSQYSTSEKPMSRLPSFHTLDEQSSPSGSGSSQSSRSTATSFRQSALGFGRPGFGQPSFGQSSFGEAHSTSMRTLSGTSSYQPSGDQDKGRAGDAIERRASKFVLPPTRPGTKYVRLASGEVSKVRVREDAGNVGWLENLGAGASSVDTVRRERERERGRSAEEDRNRSVSVSEDEG